MAAVEDAELLHLLRPVHVTLIGHTAEDYHRENLPGIEELSANRC